MDKYAFIETLFAFVLLLAFVFMVYVYRDIKLIKKIRDNSEFIIMSLCFIAGLFAIFLGLHAILHFYFLSFAFVPLGLATIFFGFASLYAVADGIKKIYREKRK